MNHIQCKCGVNQHPWGVEIWIESPRTGVTLAIDGRWWAALPHQLRDRIINCSFAKMDRLAFTPEDLKTFAAVHAQHANESKAVGTTRTGRYSRMWSGQ